MKEATCVSLQAARFRVLQAAVAQEQSPENKRFIASGPVQGTARCLNGGNKADRVVVSLQAARFRVLQD